MNSKVDPGPGGTWRGEDVAEYWDRNREKSRDPTFWMAHSLCREAINRRVSGSPYEWPLEWFKRVYGAVPFRRGVSWGCGLGPFERSAVRIGLVEEIDAFDVSPLSLGDAQREAKKEGIESILYRLGDFNDPQLERGRYDIAFFHASLHHVGALERLFRRLSFGLKRGGAIYVDEFIGPSRAEWSPEHLRVAQTVLDSAPEEAKVIETLQPPVQMDDPSEAIRAAEIPSFLSEFFDLIEWKPYGGQILDLVMPCLRHDWTQTAEGTKFVQSMIELEDQELSSRPDLTHYAVAYGRLKPLPRLMRPLGRQVAAAVHRRLKRFGFSKPISG